MTKTCLLSGADGFLGTILHQHLASTYQVDTVGFSENDTFHASFPDACDNINKEYDLIVHAAGKAHIYPKTPEEIQSFYDVNFHGTEMLFNHISSYKENSRIVFISTVAVYGEDEGTLIKEDHPLTGDSPYARSKIMAEEWLQDFADGKQIGLTIIRLPLVVGPQPKGNLGAMIKGIQSGKYLSIGKANAAKSMVLADDLGRLLAGNQLADGTFNLTDGVHPTFKQLEQLISAALNNKKVISIPTPIARMLGWCGDIIGSKFPVNSNTIKKITATLTFDDQKARQEMNWSPTSVIDETQWIHKSL